jgi:hypothetical protein
MDVTRRGADESSALVGARLSRAFCPSEDSTCRCVINVADQRFGTPTIGGTESAYSAQSSPARPRRRGRVHLPVPTRPSERVRVRHSPLASVESAS